MAKEQYIKRYGRLFAQLHFNTCKEIGLKLDKGRWYEEVTKSAETSRKLRQTYYGATSANGHHRTS
jgi:hypothetical protein